ncbi:hypothetical protein C474_17969 [Halogeometricum pallidum JCM 14848]|uniref:DUF7282 domain-containing protein n=1 Tax=Halogeometricum pallidum JCM 14848 TaxID=1227487 RepID=M0CX89_HALPD|nr:hypothetical protein [Halogeometricum pallidum]ELZ27258.1 hypothetical protein C474_17969 [Halogeometricum pallidum JCM 14848]
MQPTRPLTALVAAFLLVAVAAAPALALPPDERTRSVAVDADASAVLAAETAASVGGDLTVTRGDEVTFTVSHSGPANVTVGEPGSGFHLVVSLGGSGTDEVTIDTFATTAADPDEFVEGGDATLLSKPLSKPLMPSKYLMSVSVEGDERAVATLTVEPRGEMHAGSFVAPAEFAVAEYATDGDDADVGPLTGTMSDSNVVATGDYAVMRVEESGLESALNVEDLTGGAASNGIAWNVSQVSPAPNSDSGAHTAGRDDVANVTVLPDFEEDAVYFVWDTSAVEPDEDRPERNEYEARLTLTASNGLVEEDTVVAATTFRVVESKASLEPANDTVQYPWENDTIVVRGETTRAPNTTLEVRLRSPRPDAFLLISEATVDANREYETTIDLGGATRGVTATLWTDEFYPETAQEVTLVAPNATVRFDDQSADDAVVTLAFVEAPDGGFVRIHDADGDGVGRSEYLAPGRHENVSSGLSLPLYEAQTLRAELVNDSDGDAAYSRNDSEYTRSGRVVNDTARVAFESPPTETPAAATGTPVATATTTPTPTATPYPVLSETPLGPSDGTSGTGVPLSPAVAVAAILAAAGLFARGTKREDDE